MRRCCIYGSEGWRLDNPPKTHYSPTTLTHVRNIRKPRAELHIYIWTYIYIYIYTYVFYYIFMHVYLYTYLSNLSIYLPIYLSIYLSIFLSIYTYICIHIFVKPQCLDEICPRVKEAPAQARGEAKAEKPARAGTPSFLCPQGPKYLTIRESNVSYHNMGYMVVE